MNVAAKKNKKSKKDELGVEVSVLGLPLVGVAARWSSTSTAEDVAKAPKAGRPRRLVGEVAILMLGGLLANIPTLVLSYAQLHQVSSR